MSGERGAIVNVVVIILGGLFIAERLVRQGLVMRFFARPVPAPTRVPALISIVQPVVSGDPFLPAMLAATLTARCRWPREFLWLGDEGDATCQAICADLMARHPEQAIRYVALPPAPQGYHPKTFKLANCANMARGDVICVLDDDTALTDDALERCLPYLDQPGVGLAFGLPCAANFSTIWSSLTAVLVNANSLLAYIPAAALASPVTINGAFYAMRRQTLARVGGFVGLERYLADDFAIARRVREKGFLLAQTPLLHRSRRQVVDGKHYLRLVRRWFVTPREAVLRHLAPRDAALYLGVGVLPMLFPLVAIALVFVVPTLVTVWLAVGYCALCCALVAFNNWRYLGRVMPWRAAWLLPVVLVVTPMQILAALVGPQRVRWHDNVMQIERGGTFRYVQRRRD